MALFDFLGRSGSKQTTAPWKPQQGYLKQGFQQASDWLNSVQDPNENTVAGWNQQLQAAQSGFGGVTDSSQNLNQFFSNPNLLDPSTNQYLQMNIDALGQNITQQAARNQNLINQQAAQAGAYGGSRQGVAQGLNAEAANQAFSDATSAMLLDNYNQRLQQMQSQQQYLPQAAQLALLPGIVQEQIGTTQDNRAMDNLARFWSIVGGANWGGTTTGTSQASPLTMLTQLASAASNFKSPANG